MSEVLEKFLAFADDPEASEMFITGGAGTGKTTILSDIAEHCIANTIGHVACAFTHRAVAVLKDKLPLNTNLSTLHKFLRKVPTTNMMATRVQHVDGNAIVGEAELIEFLFIDEFSMVGADDKKDIERLQRDAEGNIILKVVYIGDENQLPPVKDKIAVKPIGDYVIYLTKVYRQADDSELLDTLIALQSYIEGKAKPAPLKSHSSLQRGCDNLVEKYKECDEAVMLAWTNQRVQDLNAEAQGRKLPIANDIVFSPTTRIVGTYLGELVRPAMIQPVFGAVIDKHTKFNPLATLYKLDIQFMLVEENWGDKSLMINRAVVFGHKNYQKELARLTKIAVDANRQAASLAGGASRLGDWAYQNPTNKYAIARSKAWREQLSFAKCVICLDFNHAMTVHKSQGSTYHTVILDTEDIGKAMRNDYKNYLKLMYVAMSRASDMVITN